MTDGSRQRALLITPSFFGYEVDIQRELEHQGYDVTFVDERPSNSALERAILRVRKNLVGRRIGAYFRKVQARLADDSFALVVVIKAEVVPRWFLVALRSQCPEARFVFYTYDAINNASNCLAVMDCFDERLSFDPVDVAVRPDFGYLPLFYTPDFHAAHHGDSRYSLAFVGTLHSTRYPFVRKLFQGQARAFGFFYVQARWYFAILKYLTREHSSVSWSEVSFTPMSRQEIADAFRESHAVLDMQRPGQSGLTMRTFEVLASGSILVTTNAAIECEPFFDPSRILIVDANIDEIEPNDVHRRLKELPAPGQAPSGFEIYSLRSWVTALTGERADG